MSFFSFLKRNKENFSLVFNIGSGSVSGGLIKFTEESGVDIIHYEKEIFTYQEKIDVSKHLEYMEKALTTLAGKIKIEGKIVDRAFYMFSSPWSISQTKVIKIKESKSIKITHEYINRVIDEQEKKYQTEISQAGKIIEKKIIQVKINGYVINNYLNKVTKDLEIAVFFTAVPGEILQVVDQAVSKTFHVKNIWCHSLALSLLTNIRNLFPQKPDFIYLDVSEEITDIGIVKDNIMISSASLPLGRNDFIRDLSLILKVTKPVADSMINLNCAGSNDELAALKLSVAMDNAARNWLIKIFEILDSFKEKIYVPEDLFLITNSDLSCFLKGKLEKHDFKVTLVENKKVKTNLKTDDIIYKLELMFLDNLYKI